VETPLFATHSCVAVEGGKVRVIKLRKFAALMAASTLVLAGCSSSSDEEGSGAYAGPVKDIQTSTG
jgi:hypothetical protein